MTEDKSYLSAIIVGDVVTDETSLRDKLGEIENLGITHTGPFELIKYEFEHEKKKIEISLWTIDSSSDNWKTIRGEYYKYASGAIVIFDNEEENWIDNLKFWVKEIKRVKSNITIVLVHDLIGKKEVNSQQIKELIAEKIFKRYKHKFSIFEITTITDEEVMEIYKRLMIKND